MLFLRTFGGLTLVDADSDGAQLTVGSSRIAILAVLAAAGDRGISRDRLLAIFWPESNERRARGALKQAVYSLRQILGEAELILGTNVLRLNPERVTADVIEFGRALEAGDPARAASLYHGPFLDGFFLRNGMEFDEWVERERARLHGAFIHSLEAMCRSADAGDDRAGAAEGWRRLVQADPLSARYALGYMRALVAAGQRETAITHADVHAHLVRQELDADVDPAIVRLKDELRAGIGPWAAAVADGSALTTSPPQILPPEDVPRLTDVTPTAASDAGLGHGSVDATAFEGVPTPADRPRITPRHRLRLGVAAGLTLVLAAAGWYASKARAGDQLGVIIVIPLENETGDPRFDAVGRLAADWLTEVLMWSRVADVIDARTTRTVTDTGGRTDAAAALALARRTGAESIVRGAVYGRGDSLRLQAQLVRAHDGKVLVQPATAAGPASDPASIVETLAQRLGGAIAATADRRFTPLAEGQTAPPRYDAYQAFLRGLELLAQRKLAAAFDAFMEAARLDTTFAQAKLYALLLEPLPGVRDSLIEATERLPDRLSPYDRAFLDHAIAKRDENYEGMLQAARRMERLAPRDAQAQILHAQAAIWTNRFSEAVATMHRTEPVRGWLDNSDYHFQNDLNAHHHLGDFGGELDEVERGRYRVEFNPCQATYLARPLAALGRESVVDSLVASCESVPEAVVPGALYLTVGKEYDRHGHPEAARRAFRRARDWYTANGWTGVLLSVAWEQRDWETLDVGLRPRFEGTSEAAVPLAAWFGVASAHLGDTTAASDMVRRLDESYNRFGGTNVAVWSALVVAALGRTDEALARIRDAMDRGFPQVRGFHGPMSAALDPLIGHPRFEAMRSDRR